MTLSVVIFCLGALCVMFPFVWIATAGNGVSGGGVFFSVFFVPDVTAFTQCGERK